MATDKCVSRATCGSSAQIATTRSRLGCAQVCMLCVGEYLRRAAVPHFYALVYFRAFSSHTKALIFMLNFAFDMLA
jgi:hypothetical protein